MNVIPLIAYSPSTRTHVKPLYETGGMTYITGGPTDFTFYAVDHTGHVLTKWRISEDAWAHNYKFRIPVSKKNTRANRSVRMWRLLAAQEPQIALFPGEWSATLANLDNCDLYRNREWPHKRGAIWLPRSSGASWPGFISAIKHVLVEKKPVPERHAFAIYMPVINDPKYGDKLLKLLDVEYF